MTVAEQLQLQVNGAISIIKSGRHAVLLNEFVNQITQRGVNWMKSFIYLVQCSSLYNCWLLDTRCDATWKEEHWYYFEWAPQLVTCDVWTTGLSFLPFYFVY